jgi:hypothetical protein
MSSQRHAGIKTLTIATTHTNWSPTAHPLSPPAHNPRGLNHLRPVCHLPPPTAPSRQTSSVFLLTHYRRMSLRN